MVVFVDLGDDDDDPLSPGRHIKPIHHLQIATVSDRDKSSYHPERFDPGVNPGVINRHADIFASALVCYPVSRSIASHLDLIDLFALASTCRAIYGTLGQFSLQLRTHSLKCANDVTSPNITASAEDETAADVFRRALGLDIFDDNDISTAPAFPVSTEHHSSHMARRAQSRFGLAGKISQCARDLVAPCQKCGIVVCRNCTIKPPSDRWLSERFRRLCKTCQDVPLMDHLLPLQVDEDIHEITLVSSSSSTGSVRSIESTSSGSQTQPDTLDEPYTHSAFTTSAFIRQPCTCHSRGVYLCQTCGHNLHAPDTTYKRVWTWRSRYSTHIGGGLGTGLGLGNQGQKCARGDNCLEKGSGGICWVEIECSDSRAQELIKDDFIGISRSSTHSGAETEHEGHPNKPGYLSQEMEGIGGVVKKKVKKRVKTGATVYEYDDERASGKYLEREASGRQRGWCGWCSRVSLSQQDKVEMDQLLKQHHHV